MAVVLYGENGKKVYALSQIYNPDTDGTDVTASGKVIPAVQSIIVDDSPTAITARNKLYIVVYVNPNTKKSTLVPAGTLSTGSEGTDRILSYGNDIFMLYYDTISITDSTGAITSLTRLGIDDKLRLFGNHSAEYQLIRTAIDGTQSVVSQEYSHAIRVATAGSLSTNGVYVLTVANAIGADRIWDFVTNKMRISYNVASTRWEIKSTQTSSVYYYATDADGTSDPWTLTWSVGIGSSPAPSLASTVTPTGQSVSIVETAVEGVRKCVNCYSYATFTDGEAITLNIYDAAGVQIGSAVLITKQANNLNELSATTNPIVAFDVKANQMLDGDIILFEGQSSSELALYPEVTYADGTTQVLAIDNVSGFMYGFEEIDSRYIGNEYPVLFKYYINEDTITSIASVINNIRYLQCIKTVRIVQQTDYRISKISTIPVWNGDLSDWKLYLYAYKENRAGFTNITTTSTVAAITSGKYRRWNRSTTNYKIKYSDANVRWELLDVSNGTVYFYATNDGTGNPWSLTWLSANESYGAIPTFTLSGTGIAITGSEVTALNGTYDLISAYVSTMFNETQYLQYNTTQINSAGNSELVTQQVQVELKNRATASIPYFLLKNLSAEITYNDNTSPYISPRITYGQVETEEHTLVNTYYIDSTVFVAQNEMSAVEVFLENFYFNANPPFLTGESIAPTPTHFTVRVPASGAVILTAPRAIANFTDPLYLNAIADQYVGSTLIVEFWKEVVEDDVTSYEILYGVPVSVIAAS